MSGLDLSVSRFASIGLVSKKSLVRMGISREEVEAEELRHGSTLQGLKDAYAQAPNAAIREEYRQKISALEKGHKESQRVNKVNVNVGLQMALCVQEYMITEGIKKGESLYRLSEITLASHNGWKTRPISKS